MLHYIFNSDLRSLCFCKYKKMNESYLPYTGKTSNYCEGVKSAYQVKTSCMSFQNVLYDWFIDWLLVAECPLCQCKCLGPLNLILGNPYCSKQSQHHALHFLYSVRMTRMMALLLYHLGMYNKWYQQNQTGGMNMLSEIGNAPQSPYHVPSLIEQRKISDRGIILVSSSKFHPWMI
jgi:hypothetical protein